MRVEVLKSDEKLFEGYAKQVTSFNSVGEFDVLAQHANFISLVNKAVILDKGLDTEKRFDIETGVIKVYKDTVQAFV